MSVFPVSGIIFISNDERNGLVLDNFQLPNETIDKIYDDVLRPSAQEIGKTVALIPRAINAALQPIDKFLYIKEINFQKCKDLMAEKSKGADPTDIVPPEPYIAIPALHALSYSIDSDELRNAYANLLSAAINKNTKNYVHPSFVESLKQLSPADVKIFDAILKNKLCAIVDLVSCSSYDKDIPVSGSLLETNISGLNIASHLIQGASFNLLSKLGFIEIRKASLTDEGCYVSICASKEYCDLLQKHSDRQNLYPLKKHFIVTDLGDLFAQICFD